MTYKFLSNEIIGVNLKATELDQASNKDQSLMVKVRRIVANTSLLISLALLTFLQRGVALALALKGEISSGSVRVMTMSVALAGKRTLAR